MTDVHRPTETVTPLTKRRSKRSEKDYPYWAFRTRRIFQRKKRADIRALLKALENARIGAAFIPDFNDLERAYNIIKGLHDKMRPGVWK